MKDLLSVWSRFWYAFGKSMVASDFVPVWQGFGNCLVRVGKVLVIFGKNSLGFWEGLIR